MKNKLFFILLATCLLSCTERFTIDTEDGPQLVGIYGTITNDMKSHEIVISKTTDFYDNNGPEMISNAEVFVCDGSDTIHYEETENPGHYQSVNPFVGQVGHRYRLSATFIDDGNERHFYSENTMPENIDHIDSIKMHYYDPTNMNLMDSIIGVFPYCPSLPDNEAWYMVRLAINDTLISDTLTECSTVTFGGMSGLYVNGQLMVDLVGEQPGYTLNQKKAYQRLHDGDKVTMYISRINKGYAGYISDISSSSGSNPMMGTPSNVRTNIYPQDEVVGYFTAYSTVNCSDFYHVDEDGR